MIKFFRKIRQNMLTENKFSKYLIYAIGEIILVVIGILIALSINNWHQEKQQKKVLNNIYANIKADLQQDIINIDEIINFSQPLEKDYLAIINKTREKDDFKDCKYCKYINFGYPDINLRKNGFELLLNYNQQNNTSSGSLSIKLNSLYVDLSNKISIKIKELALNNNSFTEIVITTQPWFADFSFYGDVYYSDDFIEYALTDLGYRNRAKSSYDLYFNGYISFLKEYKIKSLAIIDLIDEKLADE
ncbi:DUF6090 family protein [Ulvibacter antarcticus]|uniref:Uncharacterized protein n=1 Tax=Ulvibacter antarcticus TaxID=442714 RepID=A0A3L9YAG3_9FLAO|nr:DUF6090 family protein [Ulvibacter antarcticus]RMA56290.1 hypothetical protein BXY75_3411 [Ulvibacter antarcticus]